MLVEEQWGRATGALWDIPWRPSIPLAAGTEEQKDGSCGRPAAGERRDAYAITEEGAGLRPDAWSRRPPGATATAGCSTARSGT